MPGTSEAEELRAAWRALAKKEGGAGWQTIRIAPDLSCHVLAAVHFPGKEESVLFGFSGGAIPPSERLPGGHGFSVSRVQPGIEDDNLAWYALMRLPAGSPQLFEALSLDVIQVVRTASLQVPATRTFLKRLQDWQAFMRRAPEGLLSTESVIGLFGELTLLSRLLEAGMPPRLAVDAWTGPLESAQDFVLSPGAIEAKSAVGSGGFLVTISSLEQLDDSLISPLFLAGIKLSLSSDGQTLPELVDVLRTILTPLPETRKLFESRLATAGYLDTMATRYDKSYVVDEVRLFRVRESFPRLTRSTTAASILGASYRLDLDRLGEEAIPLESMLQELEVL